MLNTNQSINHYTFVVLHYVTFWLLCKLSEFIVKFCILDFDINEITPNRNQQPSAEENLLWNKEEYKTTSNSAPIN